MLKDCDALLIGAGAGMGVDSGLPDFRGKEGFWRAYPPLAKLGIKFEEMANPRWFLDDPKLAWGFYGHRYNLYHNTSPHDGYLILQKWIYKFKIPSFVFTSNVDGHFKKVGWDNQILECHGSLMRLQCIESCGQPIWELDATYRKNFEICPISLICKSSMPTCPKCGSIARPNILMFSDFTWDPSIRREQEKKLQEWLVNNSGKKLLIMEFGAGLNLPTVRSFCEKIWQENACCMIRVNPYETQAPTGVNLITKSALEALQLINNGI